MAIIKLAAPLAGIRGQLSGSIYSANLAGPYVKAYALPINPRTQKQSIQRAFIAELNSEWRALTSVQKTAWDTFAALPAQALTNSLGETYYLSGFGWFTKCNSRLSRAGLSHITAVPTQARPAAPTISTFDVYVDRPDIEIFTGGSASAESENPGFPAAKAFDGLITGGNYYATADGSPLGWLEYDIGTSTELRTYRIIQITGTRSFDPKSWTVEAWNGASWDAIDTQTDQVFVQDVWNYYTVDTPTFATKFRIDITQNNGSGTRTLVGEWEGYGNIAERSQVTYPAGTFTASPNYDLVLHIAMGATTGQQVHYPNFKEIVVDTSPPSTTEPIHHPLEDVFGTIVDGRSWFARLFRQTTEGLRSAAATARTDTQT